MSSQNACVRFWLFSPWSVHLVAGVSNGEASSVHPNHHRKLFLQIRNISLISLAVVVGAAAVAATATVTHSLALVVGDVHVEREAVLLSGVRHDPAAVHPLGGAGRRAPGGVQQAPAVVVLYQGLRAGETGRGLRVGNACVKN